MQLLEQLEAENPEDPSLAPKVGPGQLDAATRRQARRAATFRATVALPRRAAGGPRAEAAGRAAVRCGAPCNAAIAAPAHTLLPALPAPAALLPGSRRVVGGLHPLPPDLQAPRGGVRPGRAPPEAAGHPARAGGLHGPHAGGSPLYGARALARHAQRHGLAAAEAMAVLLARSVPGDGVRCQPAGVNAPGPHARLARPDTPPPLPSAPARRSSSTAASTLWRWTTSWST
jgi:hypothetical protein